MFNNLSKLVVSSSDPTKVSLMLKGLAVAIAPLMMAVFGITEANYGEIVNMMVQLMSLSLTFASVAMTLYGALRKIFHGRFYHPDA